MPKRILAADDSRTIRSAIAYTFQKEPAIELLLAPNGNAALELLRREAVDLLLLDYKMPDIDGTTLCARLKQEPQLAHIPILLLVGKQYDASQTKQIGANGVIRKPFSTSNLLKRASGILGIPFIPPPLSIEEELRASNDSIEIDIDFDGVNAPPTTPPIGGFAPPLPSTGGFAPPPLPATGNFAPPTQSGFGTPIPNSPYNQHEREMQDTDRFVPPFPPDLAHPIQDNDVIDDLPYDMSLPPLPELTPQGRPNATPPTLSKHVSNALRTPPPDTHIGKETPHFNPNTTAEVPFPPTPNKDSFPQELLAQMGHAPPPKKGEEMEVFIGKPVAKSTPPVPTRPDTSELLLPMEDELQSPLPPQKPPPLPSFSGLPASHTTPKTEPPPLPSMGSFPPKPTANIKKKGAHNPQATQKFRMMDLLDEKSSSEANKQSQRPSIVSVDDFLPSEEAKKPVPPVKEPFAGFEPKPATSPKPDAAVDTAVSISPLLSDKKEPEARLRKLSGKKAKETLFETETIFPAPDEEAQVLTVKIPNAEETLDTEDKGDDRIGKESLFETPTIKSNERNEQVLTVKVPTSEAETNPEEQDPWDKSIPTDPYHNAPSPGSQTLNVVREACPQNEAKLIIGSALQLNEQAQLLQFLQHAHHMSEKHLRSDWSKQISVRLDNQQHTTTLHLAGDPTQIALLFGATLRLWNNISDIEATVIGNAIITSLPDEQKHKAERAAQRLAIELKAYSTVLTEYSDVLSTSPLVYGATGLDNPSSVLFETKNVGPLAPPTPDNQQARNQLVSLLQNTLSIHELDEILEDSFNLSIRHIAPLQLPQEQLFLATIYHFEFRQQLPDLADVIQEHQPSFQTKPFFDFSAI